MEEITITYRGVTINEKTGIRPMAEKAGQIHFLMTQIDNHLDGLPDVKSDVSPKTELTNHYAAKSSINKERYDRLVAAIKYVFAPSVDKLKSLSCERAVFEFHLPEERAKFNGEEDIRMMQDLFNQKESRDPMMDYLFGCNGVHSQVLGNVQTVTFWFKNPR